MTMAERMAMFAPAGTRPPAGPVVAANTSGTGPAAVADGDGALRVPAVSRRDTPVVRNVVRGGSAAALTGLRNDWLDQLVSELESGRFARSATAPRISLLKTWSRFHSWPWLPFSSVVDIGHSLTMPLLQRTGTSNWGTFGHSSLTGHQGGALGRCSGASGRLVKANRCGSRTCSTSLLGNSRWQLVDA